MASSLTEQTPMAFMGEGDVYYKNQRAFTPLDQITTGISEEYNLSGIQPNYSFTQSNEPFQAFHQRVH